jgi:hypothetical protein
VKRDAGIGQIGARGIEEKAGGDVGGADDSVGLDRHRLLAHFVVVRVVERPRHGADGVLQVHRADVRPE